MFFFLLLFLSLFYFSTLQNTFHYFSFNFLVYFRFYKKVHYFLLTFSFLHFLLLFLLYFCFYKKKLMIFCLYLNFLNILLLSCFSPSSYKLLGWKHSMITLSPFSTFTKHFLYIFFLLSFCFYKKSMIFCLILSFLDLLSRFLPPFMSFPVESSLR